jgi:hypothetical protein
MKIRQFSHAKKVDTPRHVGEVCDVTLSLINGLNRVAHHMTAFAVSNIPLGSPAPLCLTSTDGPHTPLPVRITSSH